MPQEKSYRMTRQRTVILEELKNLTTHPTADELYSMVRRRLPRISLGTVYRNLEILSEMGLAQKLESAGAQRRYGGDVTDHAHIRCVGCGKVDDIPAGPKVSLVSAMRNLKGYELQGYHVDMRGLCPACRKAKKAESRR